MIASWMNALLVWATALGGSVGATPAHNQKSFVVPAAQPMRVAAVQKNVPAPDADLKSVIGGVQKHYDKSTSYTAHFEQSQLNATFGRTRKSSGVVTFKKPGKMRWDYAMPEKKTFVSDGKVLWMYEPADKQAFRQSLKDSQLPAALAFLLGDGKLQDEFDVKFAPKLNYGGPKDHKLSLTPKKVQSQYKSIYFIVDPTTFQVQQTILIDAQGNINDIRFVDAKINPKVSDGLFKWSPPNGVRVIDTNQIK